MKEDVFVELIVPILALLMMLLFASVEETLRDKVSHELDHLSSDMRVLDSLVEDHTNVSGELNA